MLDRYIAAATTFAYGANGVYDKYRTRISCTKDFVTWTPVVDLDGMVMPGAYHYGLYHNGWYYFSLSCMEDRKYTLGSYLIRSPDGLNWSEPIKLGVSASTDGSFNNAYILCGFWGQYICLMSLAGLRIGNMTNIVGNILPLEAKPNMDYHGFYNEIPGCPVNLWSYAGQLYAPNALQWTSYSQKGTAVLPVTGYAHISPVIPFNGRLYVSVAKETYPLPDQRRGQCCLLSSSIAGAGSTWSIEKTWTYDADPVKQPRPVSMNSARPYNYSYIHSANRFIQQNGKLIFVTQSSMDSTVGTNIVMSSDLKDFTTIKSWSTVDIEDLWTAMADPGTQVGSYADGRLYGSGIDVGTDYSFSVLPYPFYPR